MKVQIPPSLKAIKLQKQANTQNLNEENNLEFYHFGGTMKTNLDKMW